MIGKNNEPNAKPEDFTLILCLSAITH